MKKYLPYRNRCDILIGYLRWKGVASMSFDKKQSRYISLVIILCIIASCFSILTSAISALSTDNLNSDFPHTIYTTSISSAHADACTPEMLGRQELNSQSRAVHRGNCFSHSYKLLLHVINIIDSIHIPLYHSSIEDFFDQCEPKSTVVIIRYIHLLDGKKKGVHNFSPVFYD